MTTTLNRTPLLTGDGAIIHTSSLPPFATPNARIASGRGRVHRTVWAWDESVLVAWPTCHAATRVIAPGAWTLDEADCRNCPPSHWSPSTLMPHQIVKNRMLLWCAIVDQIGDLSQDLQHIRWWQMPSAQGRIEAVADINRSLRKLPGQCYGLDDVEIAAIYVADHRQQLMDIILADLSASRAQAA